MSKVIGKEIDGVLYQFHLKNIGIAQLQLVARKIQHNSRQQEMTLKLVDGLMTRLDLTVDKQDKFEELEDFEAEYNKIVDKINSYEETLSDHDEKLSSQLDEAIYKFCDKISRGGDEVKKEEWLNLPVDVKLTIINSTVQSQNLPEADLENFTNT